MNDFAYMHEFSGFIALLTRYYDCSGKALRRWPTTLPTSIPTYKLGTSRVRDRCLGIGVLEIKTYVERPFYSHL